LISYIKNRISFEDDTYGLYLYFIGLSYRNPAKKHYHPELRKEQVILPSVNGCRNTNLKEYLLKTKGFLSL
jgi:hypothetical protein